MAIIIKKQSRGSGVGIPESQLQTWANPGAVAAAIAAHKSVRAAIENSSALPRGLEIEIFLQGSYKNDTNIRADSDVDVVVQLNSIWTSDLSDLKPNEGQLYKNSYDDATYSWKQFRADVLNALRSYYSGLTIGEGNYCLKVPARTGALTADVLVCFQHREYRSFQSLNNQSFNEGVSFFTRNENRFVVNFPKLHYNNGVVKNTDTNQWFKHEVRVFKNARNHLIEGGAIDGSLAPSYFIECLLFNAPRENFGTDYWTTTLRLLQWLHATDFDQFVCQNRRVWLFGDSPEQWTKAKAREFANAMIGLWNDWS